MILLKIEIDNIRSHEKFIFEPSPTGTTAICGPNGAGKSTIVDSFAWCLYGTRPSGTKNSEMIRNDASVEKGDTSQVRATFVVGNREYLVSRKMINDKGNVELNVYSKEYGKAEEYSLDSGPGITSSEAFIRKLLGVDEKGFLSSTFVQQKQVDQIVSAGVKERGAVIEQLIGVDAISEASSIARAESSALQKAAQIVQTGSIEDEKERILKQKELVENLIFELESTKQSQKTTVDDFVKAEALYQGEKREQEAKNEIENKIKIEKEKLSQLQSQITKNASIYSTLTTDSFNFGAIDVKELEKELKELNKKKVDLIRESALLKTEEEKYENLYKNKIKKDVVEKYAKTEQLCNELEEVVNNAKATLVIKKEQLKHNKEFLKQLGKGIAECPMCNTPIKEIEKETDLHNKKTKALEQEIKDLETTISEGKDKVSEYLKSLIDLSKLVELKNLQDEEKKNYAKNKRKIIENKANIEMINSEISVTETTLNKYKMELQNIESINAIKKAIEETNAEIDLSNKELNSLTEELNKHSKISKTEFYEMEKSYLRLQKEKTRLEVEIVRLEGVLEVEKQKGREYKESLNRCIVAHKEHKKLSKKIDEYNLSNDSLLKFKDERIKKGIPRLVEIASEIFAKFTENKFIAVRLSSKFEASVVTANQKVLQVSQLSGGEVSSFAIALRIAIAIFLHEGSQSLLILDEVLVSMSEERGKIILEEISALTQSQIIMISHSPTINAFADKVINI